MRFEQQTLTNQHVMQTETKQKNNETNWYYELNRPYSRYLKRILHTHTHTHIYVIDHIPGHKASLNKHMKIK